MTTTDQVIETYEKLFRERYNGNNINEVLQLLRDSGASQAYTTMVLKAQLKLTLKDADHIVLNTPVWSDHKDDNESIRDSFAEILKKSE